MLKMEFQSKCTKNECIGVRKTQEHKVLEDGSSDKKLWII